MTTEDTSQSNAVLFIDSKDAFEHDGVDHYQLRNAISARRGNRILCQLAEAELPVSFYTFDNTNNQLTIDVTGSNDSESWTASISVTIPSKNYNVVQLVAQLNSLITSSYFTFIATFDTQTLKLTFTLSSSLAGTSFTKFEIVGATCLSQIGFVIGQLGSTGSSSSLVGTNAINLHRTLNVFVRTNMKVDNLDSRGEQSGIIAKVQIDQDAGGIVHYRNIENVKFQLSDTFIDHLVVNLTADDGTALNFNGLNYHLSFAFYFRRERVDPNALTLSDKVDEIEMANEEEEDDESFEDEPKYVDSLVPFAVGS